eukprot:9196681-Pyramimonas_sp.AAC.1
MHFHGRVLHQTPYQGAEYRATGGYVQVTRDAQETCSVCGPVWAPPPQTPQAGEFGALAMVSQNLRGPSEGFSDCANVVSTIALPPEARKVKAHVADSPDLTAQQRWEKFGNDAADRAARQGLRAHPTGSKAELDEVDRKVKVSRAVCRLAARLLPKWPALDLTG